MKKAFSYLGIVLFLVAASCDTNNWWSDDPGSDPVEEPDSHAPVVILSDDTGGLTVSEITEDGSVIFVGDVSRTLLPGTIICSAPTVNAPYGFLYKIKSVSAVGGNTVVETEPASLEEAIKEGSVEQEYDIADYVDEVVDCDGNPIEFSNTKGVGVGISVLLNNKVDNIGGSLTLTGSAIISGNMHFNCEFEDWTVKKIEMWAVPQVKVSSYLEGEMKFDEQLLNVKMGTIKCKPLVFFIGYIPIVITPTFEFRFKMSLHGSIEAECHLVDMTYGYKVGAAYNSVTGWTLIGEDVSTGPVVFNKITKFNVTGSLGVNFLDCTFRPVFYNFTEKTIDDNKKRSILSVNAAMPVKFTVSNDISQGFEPKVSVSLGYSLSAKSNLELFSRKIINWESNIVEREWTVWEKNIFPRIQDAEAEEYEDGKIRVSFAFTDYDKCLLTSVDDYGISLWEGGPQDGEAGLDKKSIGKLDLSSINTEHYIASIELDDLKGATTYTAVPYSYNALSTVERYGNPVTFRTGGYCPDKNHPHVIDMGLSVKWRCCNVGANSPAGVGGFYSWGETTTKSSYIWETYKYRTGGSNWEDVTLSKYNTVSDRGPVDGQTKLLPVDDAASVILKNGWRMPTLAEAKEFHQNCYATPATCDGMNGYIFTSQINGNTLFFPSAGGKDETGHYHFNVWGFYWTSSLVADDPINSYRYMVFENGFHFEIVGRYGGFQIRPVIE